MLSVERVNELAMRAAKSIWIIPMHDAGGRPDRGPWLNRAELFIAQAIRTALAEAGKESKYENVMDALRRSRMKHGRCDSVKDYGGLPKACSACMAQLELDELVRTWKGRTVRLV